MSPTTTARRVRLYPSHWREHHGCRVCRAPRGSPSVLKTLLDIVSAALEAHMTPVAFVDGHHSAGVLELKDLNLEEGELPGYSKRN